MGQREAQLTLKGRETESGGSVETESRKGMATMGEGKQERRADRGAMPAHKTQRKDGLGHVPWRGHGGEQSGQE